MGLQKWPGSGTAQIGYGVPGGVSLDRNLNPIIARQHRVGGFVNGGTTKLLEPIGLVSQFGEHANRRMNSLNAFVNSMDLGGVDLELLRTHAYESQILTSPATVDPLMSRRISLISPESSIAAYADDTVVNYFDPAKRDELIVRIDVCSPVLQVDKLGLVRTRRGLAMTAENGHAQYFADGDFMHASIASSGAATDVLATSVAGTVMLYDAGAGQCKWQQSKPRGSIGGWSRVLGGLGGSPSVALWCNRYSMATIDFREPPQAAGGQHSVLSFDDRQRHIRDLDGGIDGREAFALTSYDLVWIAAGGQSQALSVEHSLATSDSSVSLYRGSHRNHSLVTVTSQLMPMTLANLFGTTDKLPTLLDDTYFMDSWPTIIPQSHITVSNATGVSLYSVGAQGGLYKQQWNEAKLGESMDDRIDVPEPHAAVTSVDSGKAFENALDRTKPFDLLNNWTSSYVYNFERLYDVAFQPLEDTGRASEPRDAAMFHVDVVDLESFREHCNAAWVSPLEQRLRADPASVSEEALAQRRRAVDTIVSDMAAAAGLHQEKLASWHTPSVPVSKETQDILAEWSEDEMDIESSQPSQANSQPTQLPTYTSRIMSSEIDAPQSQPVPTLRSSKRKHKHKSKKPRKRTSLTQ